MAGSKLLAYDKSKIKHPGQVTLLDRLLRPIGSLVHFAAEQLEERMDMGITDRLAGTRCLRERLRFGILSMTAH